MKITFISDSDTFMTSLNYDESSRIYNKMSHVILHLDKIQEVAKEKARNQEEIKEAEELYSVDEVQCDLDSAFDEFYFLSNDKYLPNTCCHIEVVTPEVAEENDKTWLNDINYTDEDRASYKLGEVMSDYSKLDEKYYFKFM